MHEFLAIVATFVFGLSVTAIVAVGSNIGSVPTVPSTRMPTSAPAS
jgi:hypothetical protein